MKTDRELLELAARADGYKEAGINQAYTDGLLSNWNPLLDDGDALRLAVNLRLTVCTDVDATIPAAEAWHSDDICFTQTVSECIDKLAATRRAIVRAAAAIGEGMK